MATNTREEPRSPRASMVSSEADAKMVVATSREDCQKLKDLVCQKDATTMLVVMSSSKQDPHEVAPATMHPLVAAAACRGNREELNFLLNREGPQEHPIPVSIFGNQVAAYSCADMEQGTNEVSLLNGVTVEGNTALHLVAANGDGEDFLKCADLIHTKNKVLLSMEDKAGLLLSTQNKKGDTPLHCAARAGKTKMVSHLIGLSKDNNIVEELLRKENNSKETALHEAVRIGNKDIVKVLLEADPSLACFPEKGSSALYLAILQEEESIAQTLYDKSEGILSYWGPDGQNALHAAVLRSTEMVKKLLDWNQKLTSQGDCNGSTPLHFMSSRSRLNTTWVIHTILWIRVPFPASLGAQEVRRLLEANPAALYQPDKCGLYPIHIAASVGNKKVVAIFIRYCPSSAGLRDSIGRTFLHVAVEKSRRNIVSFASRTRSLAWILNMQDNDGNTALHLAAQAGSLRMFCSLFGNPQVHINIINKKVQTPLDIARCRIPPGMHYHQRSEAKIHWILKQTGVLIATVAFGATFALPGGYKADDHTNGGTPTLAGRYAFDAFIMANTIAFICSSIATVGFMFSGTSMVDLKTRKVYLGTAVFFMDSSVTSLAAAFALVEKKGTGKLRECIDFRDLNRASPKDEYPMPIADVLINAASGHRMISFLDAGKFYGFVVHEKSVEIDPKKIESIRKLQASTYKRDL
ncbi:ankyrin repeat-containing protein At5g02620 [Setaria italica]|uniref:ankyrin repeat-containing protein At5g02620 n=1 Tax=Setaria italica TaxID=4555 RepID=UPI000BE600C0|nr:ankyrin repeat-containing protein At5g02620 [Setaria italica]